MIPWVPIAAAEDVRLHVGVHAAAGDATRVRADGATGPCVVEPSWVVCPAAGPVRFSWAGDAAFALTGDLSLAPGASGTAWVLAADMPALPDPLRADDLVAAFSTVARPDGLPRPTAAALLALPTLAREGTLDVRRAAVDVLHDWTWRSRVGPLAPGAPLPIPAGWLTAMADDDDFRVRIALAELCRDLRADPSPGEIEATLVALTSDPHPNVRQAALRSLVDASRATFVRPGVAWRESIAAVPEPGAPGRVASQSLARLAPALDPEDTDAVYAVALVLEHHPDAAWRVWAAFKERVPFQADWALTLLRGTKGLNQGLVRYWSRTSPTELAAVIRAWEPGPTHSKRFALVRDAVQKTRDVDLKAAVGL